MAQEGSVAPKERVNITYQAATGDATEEKELPLKFLCLGDYTGRPDDTPLEDRKAISINKDNFNDVLKGMAVSIKTNVANTLEAGEEAGELPVELKIESMKDFGPESVAQQVPELQKLLQLREALAALKGPLGNFPDFRKRLQALLGDDAKRSKILEELGSAEG